MEMMKAKAELRSVMHRAVKEINCSMVKVSDRHQVLNGEVDSCGRGSLHNTVVAKNLEKLNIHNGAKEYLSWILFPTLNWIQAERLKTST